MEESFGHRRGDGGRHLREKTSSPTCWTWRGETAAFDTPEFVTLLEGLHTLQFTRTVEEGELYQSTTGSYPVLDNTTRLVASAALSQEELMGYLTGQIDGILLPEATEQGSRLFTGSPVRRQFRQPAAGACLGVFEVLGELAG